jgi:hypothetical protein
VAELEQRGMASEAIELLGRNVGAGANGAEMLRWLSLEALEEERDDPVPYR